MIKKMNLFQTSEIEITDVINDFLFCLLNVVGSDNIVVKGCVALTAAANKYDVSCKRGTRDLDLQNLNYEKWNNFKDNFNDINKFSKLGLIYSLEKCVSKGEPVAYEKLTVVAKQEDSLFKFSVDVQISDFNYKKEIYNIYTLDFDGSAVETMLADKLNAIKDRTIFRRAKDIYDIYLISTMKKFHLVELVDIIEKKRDLKCDNVALLDLNNINDIAHAYNKLTSRSYEKLPEFDEVYHKVVSFVVPIFDSINGKVNYDMFWDGREWNYVTKL